jgi:hypothetical protein
MPAHYVYKDPDKTTLCQGDVLGKTEPLVAHLAQYHPYYSNHVDYKYFMVLTQSCDLVRRDGKPPTSPYIALAAVRPVEEALRREAAKSQTPWQREVRVIGTKAQARLAMFLESLLDNNKEGYFYLHQDVGLGIAQNCCAFLQLSVALKAEHYDLCLAAKIAELTEPFQAKLGYLVGHMYNRVGTAEWDDNCPDNPVRKAAASLLKMTFVVFDDAQIQEGVAELQRDGPLEARTPEEIKDYINRTKVIPRHRKFHDRALKVLVEELKPIDMIRGRINAALTGDSSLRNRIEELLAEAGIAEGDRKSLLDSLVAKFNEALREYLSDDKMPGKADTLERIIAKLLQDPQIMTIMR